MKLGAIIVTYNRVELLKECVDACIKQTYPFEKIFIVNNASNDNTEKYLKELKYPNIEYVNLSINIGGAGGFSKGTQYFCKNNKNKKIDYLLFIDDDAIIENEYNEKIVKQIKQDKNIDFEKEKIIAYSGCVITNENIIYEHRRFLKRGFKQINSIKKDYENDYFDYDLSTFCGVFISMNVINRIGFPRSDFFIWYDDTEYCLRLKDYGVIRNVNNAILNHKTKIDDQECYSWKSYYGIRNKYIILKEYFDTYQLVMYTFDIILHYIYNKILFFIKNDEYYNEISKIYKNAYNDAKNQKLGLNENFTYKKVFRRKK